MNILFVITGLGMGGAENLVVNLADKYSEQGHQVAIVYLLGEAIVIPVDKNIQLYPLDMNSYRDVISAYIKLRRVILDFQPDVVHSHMIHANLLSRIVRLSTHIANLVCTAHNTNEGGKLRMLAYRVTDHLANVSTNVSGEAVARFIEMKATTTGRMLSVPNGIDTVKFKFDLNKRLYYRNEFKDGDKKVIIAVGRFNKQKDYPNLFNAVAILAEKRSDFCVKIVGDGPLRDDLVQLTRELNIERCIQFLGISRDISGLMSASDIFVLSSAFEGFGLVVAEAMACARAIVATDCGGVSEVVGTAGLLVEVGDSTALANALISQLNKSNKELADLGYQARERIVNNFSLDNTAKEYMKLFKGNY